MPLLHLLWLIAALLPIGFTVADAVARSWQAGHVLDAVAPSRWLVLLGHTAGAFALAWLVAVVGGGVLGLLAGRCDLPGRSFVLAVCALLACLPVYVVLVLVFSVIPLWQYAGSLPITGVLYGLTCLPVAVLVLATVFRGVDRSIEEQARLDANWPRVFRHATLPQAMWGVLVVTLIVLVIVATDFTVADIMVVRTFADEVYYQFALQRSAVGPVLAAIPLFVVVTVLLALATRRLRERGGRLADSANPQPLVFPLRRWRWTLAAIVFVLLAALLATVTVGIVGHLDAQVPVWQTAASLLSPLCLSMVSAAVAATLLAAFGVGWARWALQRDGVGRFTRIVVTIVLAVPAPLVGIGLIGLLNRPGVLGWIYDSPACVVFGYLVRMLPFAVILLLPAAARVPAELVDAARVDGADWLAIQRHVVWPLALRDVLIAWLILAILCFGEIGTTVLLAAPGWEPAAVQAFTLLHFGVYQDLAVLAVLAAACVLAPWGGLMWILRPSRRRTRERA